MIKRVKRKDAAVILGLEVHKMKTLQDTGLLVGTKLGKGYWYDTEQLEDFIRDTRGLDLGTEEKIQAYASMKMLRK